MEYFCRILCDVIFKKYDVVLLTEKEKMIVHLEKKVSIFFIEVYLFPNLNLLTLELDILEIY